MLLDGVWVENLVRFPVEKRTRPSFEMMCDLAPDSRMIPMIAEALQVDDIDPELRDAADREMGEHLATLIMPESGTARRQYFIGLREQTLAPAIHASIEAKRLADDAYRASRAAIDAEQMDRLNASALALRANHFLNASARAALEAHRLCEIARGKCRALTLAEMGEAWVPFDAQEAGTWLIAAANRAKTRHAAGKS